MMAETQRNVGRNLSEGCRNAVPTARFRHSAIPFRGAEGRNGRRGQLGKRFLGPAVAVVTR